MVYCTVLIYHRANEFPEVIPDKLTKKELFLICGKLIFFNLFIRLLFDLLIDDQGGMWFIIINVNKSAKSKKDEELKYDN